MSTIEPKEYQDLFGTRAAFISGVFAAALIDLMPEGSDIQAEICLNMRMLGTDMACARFECRWKKGETIHTAHSQVISPKTEAEVYFQEFHRMVANVRETQEALDKEGK